MKDVLQHRRCNSTSWKVSPNSTCLKGAVGIAGTVVSGLSRSTSGRSRRFKVNSAFTLYRGGLKRLLVAQRLSDAAPFPRPCSVLSRVPRPARILSPSTRSGRTRESRLVPSAGTHLASRVPLAGAPVPVGPGRVQSTREVGAAGAPEMAPGPGGGRPAAGAPRGPGPVSGGHQPALVHEASRVKRQQSARGGGGAQLAGSAPLVAGVLSRAARGWAAAGWHVSGTFSGLPGGERRSTEAMGEES